MTVVVLRLGKVNRRNFHAGEDQNRRHVDILPDSDLGAFGWQVSSWLRMNVEQVLATYRSEGRHHQWPDETVLQLAGVTRRSSSDGALNMVTAYDLTDADADRVIAEEVAYFRERGQGFEWKTFSYDTPSDLVQRLERHGLSVGRVLHGIGSNPGFGPSS